MGLRTQYTPGTFCYLEHASANPKQAAEFYGRILGWDIEAVDYGDMLYRVARVEGSAVAGVVAASSDTTVGWYSYVSVDDVDVTTKTAEQNGATVTFAPFDVPDMGRMSIITDPQGADVCLWEPRGMIGCERVNDAGCLTLNQLNTTDPEGAQRFYEATFGWEFRGQDSPGEPYWGIYNQGNLNGGMMQSPLPESSWLVYFTTIKQLEDAASDINSAGGAVIAGPMPIPEARILLGADTLGIPFALYEGRVDD